MEIQFLCAINIFSKHILVVTLQDKKCIIITKILDESGRRPNNTWEHKSSEFYDRSMKSWLQDNDIEIHSAHIEVKLVVAEIFIRSLKHIICKYMNTVSKVFTLAN